MTDHILNLMENRKQFKNSDKDEYNRQNKQINLACKEAKEKWLVNQYEEVEQVKKTIQIKRNAQQSERTNI